jgi:predicted alpha/beta-fold hydrolase
MMVSAGFDADDILHKWPYDKFCFLRDAVIRQELNNRKMFAIGVSMGASSLFDAKGLKKYLKELDEASE